MKMEMKFPSLIRPLRKFKHSFIFSYKASSENEEPDIKAIKCIFVKKFGQIVFFE